jgi:hypothetical protein
MILIFGNIPTLSTLKSANDRISNFIAGARDLPVLFVSAVRAYNPFMLS